MHQAGELGPLVTSALTVMCSLVTSDSKLDVAVAMYSGLVWIVIVTGRGLVDWMDASGTSLTQKTFDGM